MINAKNLTNAAALLCLWASANGLAAPQDTKKSDKHIAACRAVVEAENLGRLADLVVPLADSAKVDINNDGKPERVELRSEGTMRVEGLEVFTENGTPIELAHSDEDDWDNDNVRWAMDQVLIKYSGQVYILGKTDDYLHYLAHVDKHNVEKLVCQFAQRKEPVEKLVTSKNDELCQRALKRELNYVAFDRTHALTNETVNEAGFYETSPSKLAAFVDIDNDGKAELVVQLQLASGRGRGCGADHLGVLNDARNKLNMEMTNLLPEPGCDRVVQTPFVFEGQTYIEMLGAPSNTHRVVQLKKNQLDTVCEYAVRKVNYVLGEYERILANAESAHVDPWSYALEMPGTDGLQALMDAKHDLRLKVRSTNFGTVIHEAIRLQQYAALEFLLKNGADPNIRDDAIGQPALIFAVCLNRPEAVHLLLKHGADRNQTWNGIGAKDWASRQISSERDKAAMLELLSK
jgi:hypothetical protein